MDELSSEGIRSLLTSLFPSQMVDDLTRKAGSSLQQRLNSVQISWMEQ